MSDAKLRVKVALQQAGIIGAPVPAPAAKDEGKPNGQPKANGSPAPPPTAADHQAAANLARDVRAARDADGAVVDSDATPVARALQEPETRVSDEGTNLIKGTRAE